MTKDGGKVKEAVTKKEVLLFVLSLEGFLNNTINMFVCRISILKYIFDC